MSNEHRTIAINTAAERSTLRVRALAAIALACAVCLLAASAARAASPGPNWVITAQSAPSHFAPGDSADQYLISVVNAGQATDGSPITITDTLPPGVTATGIDTSPGSNSPQLTCDLASLTCTTTQDPGADSALQVTITVAVAPDAAGTLTDTATVSGGGGATVSTTAQTPVSTAPVPYGLSYLQTEALDASGAPQTQAGSHPFELTTAFGVNISGLQTLFGTGPFPTAPADARDVDVVLPPGLVGDPGATPQCSQAQFNGAPGNENCPVDTQVGITQVFFAGGDVGVETYPVYNIAPPPGQPAEFGFTVGYGGDNYHVPIFFGVRTGSDYGLTAEVTGIPEAAELQASVLTIWGTPADPSHDSQRFTEGGPPPASSGAPLKPLLTYPTDCRSGAMTVTASSDSWQDPGAFASTTTSLPAPTNCDALSFQPSLSLSPDNLSAGQPAGLQVDLHVPQTDDPNTLATPELQNATVTLPQGVVINPGSADGLEGCSDAQIAVSSSAAATCPDASQIGTVQVTTPLLSSPLEGQVFVGTPQCSPCTNTDAQDGRMVRLFIQAQGSGVTIKLAGTVSVDPVTGRLTTTFDQNPQLPFTDLLVTFKGGPRAPVANPTRCGTYTATSDLAPWSSPFTPDATPFSSFTISGCGNPDVFAPSFSAGALNPQAGAFSPFTLTFSRSDSDQDFSGLTAVMPPGVSAKLAGVPLCSDADANAGTCPAASQVGTATIASGPGSEPLWIPQPGAPQPAVYLTGPYKGAPYGLVVETPAIAGPYNIGTIVVRQALYVDPTDAHVTVVSDPFPTILDGIPLQIRTVSVTLNRRDFTLNPTSCNPMPITGTLTSTGGLTYTGTSRFQVGGCQELGFSPKLKIALTGKRKTRSGDHPTLTATLTDPSGQANIHSARVALPLSMALDPNNSQHVCNYYTAQAVHGGSVGCPASTIVGQATAVTPLLSQPLTGPVYLVQGIRFGAQGQAIHTLPSLLIPLRGQIALDLRAQSSVSGGKLVTTFATIPDAPVSKFTLQITGGPRGLLVITGRGKTICGKAQVASGQFGAQSGKTEGMDPTLATPACGKAASLRGLRVVGHTIHVSVRVPAAGRLVARGAGLRSQVRRPGRAGTIALVLDISPAEAAKLNRTGQLSTRVTVSWTPRGGGLHTMTTGMLTIRR